MTCTCRTEKPHAKERDTIHSIFGQAGTHIRYNQNNRYSLDNGNQYRQNNNRNYRDTNGNQQRWASG